MSLKSGRRFRRLRNRHTSRIRRNGNRISSLSPTTRPPCRHQDYARYLCTRTATFLERFQREARIVARLEHPHIVSVYDYDEFQGQPYFVMQYIEGGTLKRRLIKRGITLEQIKNA